jgi:hypothetical protein
LRAGDEDREAGHAPTTTGSVAGLSDGAGDGLERSIGDVDFDLCRSSKRSLLYPSKLAGEYRGEIGLILEELKKGSRGEWGL